MSSCVYVCCIRGSRKFSQRGSNFDNFFNLMRGEGIQIPLLYVGNHWPASELPFKWLSLACQGWPNIECWLVIFQGIRTSIAKKPYIFVIFQVGSGPHVPLSGSAHQLYIYKCTRLEFIIEANTMKSGILFQFLITS